MNGQTLTFSKVLPGQNPVFAGNYHTRLKTEGKIYPKRQSRSIETIRMGNELSNADIFKSSSWSKSCVRGKLPYTFENGRENLSKKAILRISSPASNFLVSR